MSEADTGSNRRVSFALGIWQLVVLCACLDQADAEDGGAHEDHLVLYGPNLPPELRTAMSQMAGAVARAWTSVTWADDLMLKPSKPGGDLTPRIAALTERVGIDSCADVWLCKLFDFPEKMVAEAFPSARLTLFEDGMYSYIPQPTFSGASDTGAFWTTTYRIALRTVGRGDPYWTSGVLRSQQDRVEQTFWVLPDAAGLARPGGARNRQLDLRRLREALGVASGLSGFQPPARPAEPVALVLGQNFARGGLMSEEAEWLVYRRACEQLLRLGFRVMWKDHPRLEVGFGPRLVESLSAMGPIEILSLASAWPVEVAVDLMRPAAVVSATSTSPFVCSALWGTAAYTFESDLRWPLWRRDHHHLARMSRRAFGTMDRAWQSVATCEVRDPVRPANGVTDPFVDQAIV